MASAASAERHTSDFGTILSHRGASAGIGSFEPGDWVANIHPLGPPNIRPKLQSPRLRNRVCGGTVVLTPWALGLGHLMVGARLLG
jgi:hypothetical protein